MLPLIKVAVSVGHERDRGTIAAILAKQKDFRIASIGTDSFDALISAKNEHPDIIIMDFCMDDIDSAELAPIIRRSSPETSLIALCSCRRLGDVSKALKAGFSGCLFKSGGFGAIPASVRCVYHGGLYLCQSIKRQVLDSLRESQLPEAAAGDQGAETQTALPDPRELRSGAIMSVTELRIFTGIALGQSDNDIARNLNISTGALRNCINRFKCKTMLKNRTQMAIFALSAVMGTSNLWFADWGLGEEAKRVIIRVMSAVLA